MNFPSFNLEVLKLLLQAAWADDEIQPQERELIQTHARTLQLAPDEVVELETYLNGHAPLPPPNLGLLRLRREEAIQAVRTLLLVDDRLEESETIILEQVEELLG